MTASVQPYLEIVKRAYTGQLKLPAFQRNWAWNPSQVVLLLDSLRQGFPIGSFLFIESSPEIELSPREFRSSSDGASGSEADFLVLDGQQRITAGLELFFDRSPNHYFIDINRVRVLAKDVDLDSKDSIGAFLSDLEAEDGYCRKMSATQDPRSKLIGRKLLWTGLLLDDDSLDRAIYDYSKTFPEDDKLIRYLIGRNFRPKDGANIPVTTIPGQTSIEAVSRIFATLNNTGRILTPFELVVSILFPKQIDLYAEVGDYKELCPSYGRIDKGGDILLQTIALFDGKSTKKASLPKTIDGDNFKKYASDAADYLNKAAELISHRAGLGLEASDELLIYPVIFPPLAFVMKELDALGLDHGARAAAEAKLVRWYVGAILSRRYQQSTHDKQARDKAEIRKWIVEGDASIPAWLSETYAVNLRYADPDGSVGKLFRSLMNLRNLRDPLTNEPVGVGAQKMPSQKHHIFPSKWVRNLAGWDDSVDSANIALNLMYTTQATNARWLNSNPREQLLDSIKCLGSEAAARELYRQHAVSDAAFNILFKPEKSREDFIDFISEREATLVGLLEHYGFRRPVRTELAETEEELDSD